MDAEFASLEDKLGQLVGLCQALRSENRQLRQQVLGLQQDNQQLQAKVEGARHRVAAILNALPEDMQ
ncbi:cell division protein ZapB [Jeongeupia sp. HS-3]|uniref:cell division protein ZapB n=1 Tax=Jeongeupia sp. HS-3 TaxID=1009682 RepID=UPI0019109607